MNRPLSVVFLWHLHQPLYKDPASGRCLLPWARLHGVNAYTTMALLADEFAELPLTFNLVPCLGLQIQEYATGAVSDPWLEAALRPADGLELDERSFLLRWFFLGRPEAMILPHPRYRELWQLRGSDGRRKPLGILSGAGDPVPPCPLRRPPDRSRPGARDSGPFSSRPSSPTDPLAPYSRFLD